MLRRCVGYTPNPCLSDGGDHMKTKWSASSRRLRAGIALRALAAGSSSAGEFQSATNPRALFGSRSLSRCLIAAFAALGLTVVALTSPGHAQAPPLGTT